MAIRSEPISAESFSTILSMAFAAKIYRGKIVARYIAIARIAEAAGSGELKRPVQRLEQSAAQHQRGHRKIDHQTSDIDKRRNKRCRSAGRVETEGAQDKRQD